MIDPGGAELGRRAAASDASVFRFSYDAVREYQRAVRSLLRMGPPTASTRAYPNEGIRVMAENRTADARRRHNEIIRQALEDLRAVNVPLAELMERWRRTEEDFWRARHLGNGMYGHSEADLKPLTSTARREVRAALGDLLRFTNESERGWPR